MSFGGSQGSIRYQLILDDMGFNQKIGTAKQSLASLAPATQQVNQNMNAMGNSFTTAGTGITTMTGNMKTMQTQIGTTNTQMTTFKTTMAQVGTTNTDTANTFKAGLAPAAKQAGDAMANNTKQLQQNSAEFTTLGSKIKTGISNFSNLAIGISATATSTLQLAAGFRDYNDAQIQVERVTRRVSVAHESLQKAQDKLNALEAKGIKSGKEHEQALLDVKQAEQQVDIQTQLLGESQERLFDSQSQFAVSIIPTVLGAVGTLGTAFGTLAGKGDKLKGGIVALGGGFTSMVSAIKNVSWTQLAAGITGVAAPILAVGGAVWLTVGSIQGLMNVVDLIKPKLQEGAHEINALYAAFLTFKRAAPTLFGPMSEQEKLDLAGWEKTINQGLGITKEKVKVTTKDIANAMGQGFTSLRPELIGPVKEFANTFGNTLKDAVGTFGTAADQTTPKVEDMTQSVSDSVFAAGDAAVAVINHRDALNARQSTMEKDKQYFETLQTLGNQHATTTDNLTGKVIGLSKADALLAQKMNAELTPAQLDDIEAQKQAYIQYQLTTSSVKQLTSAQSEGAKQFTTTVDGLINGTAAANDYRQRLIAWAIKEKGIKDAASLTNEQIIERTHLMDDDNTKIAQQQKLLEQNRQAWQKTVDEFAKTKIDAAKIFGFDKKFDSDKVFKDMVKDLPSKLEKQLKGTIKANFKIEETETGVKKFIQTIMDPLETSPGHFEFNPELEMDPKTAIEYGRDILKKIKNIPGKDTADAGKKLADAIAKGDYTAITQAIIDVLNSIDADKVPAIPVYLVPAPDAANKLSKDVGTVKVSAVLDTMSNKDWKKIYSDPYNRPDQYYISGYNSQGKPQYKHLKKGYTNVPGDTGGTTYHTPSNEKNPFKKWDNKGNLWIWNFETGKWDKAESESGIDERLQQSWTGQPNGPHQVSMGGITSGSNADTEAFLAGRGGKDVWQGTGNTDFNKLVTQAATATTKIKDLFIQSFMAINKGMTMITSGWSGFTNMMITTTANATLKDKDLFITSFMEVAKGMDIIAKGWSAYMNSFIANASSAGQGVNKSFDKMISKASDGFGALATQWSTDMNSLISNASSAGKGVNKAFDKMISKASDGFGALASQWSTDMNSLISNAKSAASGVNKALGAIKDVNVTVHVGVSGPGLQYAQSGMHETLEKDTLIMAHKGERVDIGPAHGGPTSSSGGGGPTQEIHIHNHLEREVVQILTIEKSRLMSRMGPI